MKLCSDHCTLLLTFVFLVFNVRLSSRNASTRHLFWSKLKIFTWKVSIICEFVTSWFVSLTLFIIIAETVKCIYTVGFLYTSLQQWRGSTPMRWKCHMCIIFNACMLDCFCIKVFFVFLCVKVTGNWRLNNELCQTKPVASQCILFCQDSQTFHFLLSSVPLHHHPYFFW